MLPNFSGLCFRFFKVLFNCNNSEGRGFCHMSSCSGAVTRSRVLWHFNVFMLSGLNHCVTPGIGRNDYNNFIIVVKLSIILRVIGLLI